MTAQSQHQSIVRKLGHTEDHTSKRHAHKAEQELTHNEWVSLNEVFMVASPDDALKVFLHPI